MEEINSLILPFLESVSRAGGQGAVMILVVLALQWLLRHRLSPQWRYMLWVPVLVRLAMPALPSSPTSFFNWVKVPEVRLHVQVASPNPEKSVAAQLPLVGEKIARVAEHRREEQVSRTVAGYRAGELTLSSSSGAQSRSAWREWQTWAGLVWLSGAALLGGCLAWQTFRLSFRIGMFRQLTDPELLNLLEDCKVELGVHVPLVVVETDRVKTPALFGFLRPRLLLPHGLKEALSLAEIRYVFLHELGHVKRKDIFLSWVMSVFQVIHWFNPLVWIALSRMRMDRELACDALVLSRIQCREQNEYGNTIIKLLENFCGAIRLPIAAGILEDRDLLKKRVGLIVQPLSPKNWRVWGIAAVSLLGLTLLTEAHISHPSELGGRLGKEAVRDAKQGGVYTLRRVLTPRGYVELTDLVQPRAARFDSQGRLWIVESSIDEEKHLSTSGPHRIRVVDTTGTFRFVAGGDEPGFADGPGTVARFSGPCSIAFDSVGNVIVADTYNHRIRRIDADGNVSTLAGAEPGFQDGEGSDGRFNRPMAVCVDKYDNVFVADFGNHSIRMITASGIVVTYSGNGSPGGEDGHVQDATFSYPSDVVMAPDGSLLISEWMPGRVRKISPGGNVSVQVTPLPYLEKMEMDSSGAVYVVCQGGGNMPAIIKLNMATRTYDHFSAQSGHEDGSFGAAGVGRIEKLSVLPDGTLLFPDSSNNSIRFLVGGLRPN